MQSLEIIWFMSCLSNQTLVTKLREIKLIVCDIDGCLTDGNIYLPEDKEELKGFSVQDGLGIAEANKVGVHVAFLSGRSSKSINVRAEKLGIPKELCKLGVPNNKLPFIAGFQEHAKADRSETLFFGDDVQDLSSRPAVNIFIAPENGIFYVKSAADLVLPLNGGQSALRLLIDLILYVQEKHFAQQLIKDALQQYEQIAKN